MTLLFYKDYTLKENLPDNTLHLPRGTVGEESKTRFYLYNSGDSFIEDLKITSNNNSLTFSYPVSLPPNMRGEVQVNWKTQLFEALDSQFLVSYTEVKKPKTGEKRN